MSLRRTSAESRLEREQRESAERRLAYLADKPSTVTLRPGPGRSAEEVERLAANRRAAEEAAEATKAAQREQAEQSRQIALEGAERLRAFKARLDADTGRIRQELRLAVDATDFDRALEAAGQVVALELVHEELKMAEKRFSAANRGAMYFLVDAGRV